MRCGRPVPGVDDVALSRNGWLLGACAAGLVHAGVSASWALGSPWLLDTVGQWAVDWRRDAPVNAALVVGVVALVKAAGAVVPVLVEADRLPGRRWWRAASWAGAVVLVGYGLANAIGAWLVLAGVVDTHGTRDPSALVGHAVLWDPLFALWGVLLAAGLHASRRRA